MGPGPVLDDEVAFAVAVAVAGGIVAVGTRIGCAVAKGEEKSMRFFDFGGERSEDEDEGTISPEERRTARSSFPVPISRIDRESMLILPSVAVHTEVVK